MLDSATTELRQPPAGAASDGALGGALDGALPATFAPNAPLAELDDAELPFQLADGGATASHPSSPGFRARGFPDPSPSQDPAIAMVERGPTLRSWIVRRMAGTIGTWTPDEMARELGLSVLAVRPRYSELHQTGRIERTEERRPSGNGHAQCVHRLAQRTDGCG